MKQIDEKKQNLYYEVYQAKKQCYEKALLIGKVQAKNRQFAKLKSWLRSNKDQASIYKTQRANGLRNSGDFLKVQKERELNPTEFKALCFYMCFRQEFLNYVSCAAFTSDVQREFDALFDPHLLKWTSSYSDFKNINLYESIF